MFSTANSQNLLAWLTRHNSTSVESKNTLAFRIQVKWNGEQIKFALRYQPSEVHFNVSVLMLTVSPRWEGL